jgi:hypothetical protein
VLNPDQLIELADEICQLGGVGAPRQVNLRRAASTAYYAVFHVLLGTIAETFVSANQRKARALFYRAVEHRATRDRCKKLRQDPLPQAERSFFRFDAFPVELRLFANNFVRLQEHRHSCDYDPDFRTTRDQTRDMIETARDAIASIRTVSDEFKVPFLSYLLFGFRG